MTTATWFKLIGMLLLVVGFTFSWLKSLPVTSAIVYLLVGCVVGPMGLGLFHFNPLKESLLLELLTELAVLISLYYAGVKMPAPSPGRDSVRRYCSPLHRCRLRLDW